jgi:hypothetical protein
MAAQFSIYGTAGMSGLKYKVEGGAQKYGFGYGGGAGYFIKLNSMFNMGTALEIATYSSEVSFGILSERYEQGTGEDKLRFAYSQNSYAEKQSVTMLSIPATVQYQTTGGIYKWCFTGGVKIGLPISAQANIDPGTVVASGEFEHEGQTYTNLPQHGFPNGTKLPTTKCDIDLGVSVAATLEAGLLIRKFYLGAYLDYGLTNMQKTQDKHPLEYHEPLVHNSILNSGLVNKINLFNMGLKIKMQF